jgi:hypothetical protein
MGNHPGKADGQRVFGAEFQADDGPAHGDGREDRDGGPDLLLTSWQSSPEIESTDTLGLR